LDPSEIEIFRQNEKEQRFISPNILPKYLDERRKIAWTKYFKAINGFRRPLLEKEIIQKIILVAADEILP
jgi:hypothetical protein